MRLEARGVGHRYAALRGLAPVDFAIESPGLVAFIGPNGSGKSTLLRILAGLLKPNEGSADFILDGVRIPPAARAAHVGFTSPDVMFYDEMTTRENLVFAAEARGVAGVDQAAEAALGRVGLADRSADRVDALSSGLVQRLRLAFALLQAPPVLLLDEPGSHLDDAGRILLEGLLQTARTGSLVLVATNDEREWRLADRTIELASRSLGRPA